MPTTLESQGERLRAAEQAALKARLLRDEMVIKAVTRGESKASVAKQIGVTRATMYAILRRMGYDE